MCSAFPPLVDTSPGPRPLAALDGSALLIGQLLYGSGLRAMEALRLRVKDIALEPGELVVRDGKGGKDRVPNALAAKYPGVGTQWGWLYVFPAASLCQDPYSGRPVRHHLHKKTLQRAMRNAMQAHLLQRELREPADSAGIMEQI